MAACLPIVSSYYARPIGARAATVSVKHLRSLNHLPGAGHEALDRACHGTGSRIWPSPRQPLNPRLTPLDWRAPGPMDGSRRDSGPMYDGTLGAGAWDVKGRW